MQHTRKRAGLLKSALLGAATLGALSLAGAGVAQAALLPYSYPGVTGIDLSFQPYSISGSIPFQLEDLSSGVSVTGSPAQVSVAGATVSYDSNIGTHPSGIYDTTTQYYKSPFGAGSNRAYIVAQAGGSAVTVAYNSAQSAIGLLWGTVDSSQTGYNNLDLTINNNTTSSYTVTGQNIRDAFNSIPLSFTSGTTSAWVQISLTSGDPIGSFSASDTTGSPAFEYTFARPGQAALVPEPGSLALLGTGLLGLGLVARRRRRKA